MVTKNQLITLTQEIFQLCREQKYTQLAAKLAYKGPDKGREYQFAFDYFDEYDVRQVEATAHRIVGFMEGVTDTSGGITFGEMFESVTDGKQWYAIEVFFNLGPDRKVRYFGFVQTPHGLLLGDIDR